MDDFFCILAKHGPLLFRIEQCRNMHKDWCVISPKFLGSKDWFVTEYPLLSCAAIYMLACCQIVVAPLLFFLARRSEPHMSINTSIANYGLSKFCIMTWWLASSSSINVICQLQTLFSVKTKVGEESVGYLALRIKTLRATEQVLQKLSSRTSQSSLVKTHGFFSAFCYSRIPIILRVNKFLKK
jgi:hypothetical protein